MIELAHREALFVDAIGYDVFSDRIQTHNAIDRTPRLTGFLVRGLCRELQAARDDDDARIQIKRTPLHGAAINDRSVTGFEGNAGA